MSLLGLTTHERKYPVTGSTKFHFCKTGCFYHRRQPANLVFHHVTAQYMTHQWFQQAIRRRLKIHHHEVNIVINVFQSRVYRFGFCRPEDNRVDNY